MLCLTYYAPGLSSSCMYHFAIDCIPAPGFVCVDVATTVTVSHSPAVQRQNVRHELLSLVDNIKSLLPYQTTYTGNQSVQADMVVNLQGVPPRDMGREEIDLFEKVMLNFISEKLGNDYDISGAEVISQSSGGEGGATGIRRLLSHFDGGHHHGRSLQSSSAGALDVTVRITGESRNPRKRQLEEKIEDAIDNDSVAFTEELATAAKRDPVVSAYFEKVEEVSSKPVDGEDSPPAPSPALNSSGGGGSGDGPSIGLIIGCVLGGIVAIAIAALLYVKGVVGGDKKKKKQEHFEQQLSSFGTSQRFGGYDDRQQPPRYAGNGNMNPAIYGKGSIEKQNGYEKDRVPAKMQSIYGAPGAAALQSKRALAANIGEANVSRMQPMHSSNSKFDAKLAYNGAGSRASTRQIQTNQSRSKLDAKLAYNGAPVPQSPRQVQRSRSNSRDDMLERKIAMNGGAITDGVRVNHGQRPSARSMRAAGDSRSVASGGDRMPRQDYHSSQGIRPSTSRGSLQSLDSAPSRGRRTSRTSHGSQSSRFKSFNESGLSSNSGNSGGFRGEEDLHFR